jgi:hypothetical protein
MTDETSPCHVILLFIIDIFVCYLDLDKSEKGKGTTTISPFINLPMPHPPQILTNL